MDPSNRLNNTLKKKKCHRGIKNGKIQSRKSKWKICPKLHLKKIPIPQIEPSSADFLRNDELTVIDESPEQCLTQLREMIKNAYIENSQILEKHAEINSGLQLKLKEKEEQFNAELKQQIDSTKKKKWCFICNEEVPPYCITSKPICSKMCLEKLLLVVFQFLF